LADVDEVVGASRGLRKTVGKTGQRFNRYPVNLGMAIFLQAAYLARKGVEFSIRCQHPDWLVTGQAREQAHQKAVRIRTERQAGRIWQVENAGDSFLQGRPCLGEQVRPFAVRQARRVLPTLHLRRVGHVRPRMVAVRGDVQAVRVGGKETAEVRFCVHRDSPAPDSPA